jgi:hypothetical protein
MIDRREEDTNVDKRKEGKGKKQRINGRKNQGKEGNF